MATKEDYAYYCIQFMEGDSHMIGELYDDLMEDGFVDEDQEWIPTDIEDEDEED